MQANRVFTNNDLRVLKALNIIKNKNNFNPILNRNGEYCFRRQDYDQNIDEFRFAKGCKLLGIRTKEQLNALILTYSNEFFHLLPYNLSQNFKTERPEPINIGQRSISFNRLKTRVEISITDINKTMLERKILYVAKNGTVLNSINKDDYDNNKKYFITTKFGYLDTFNDRLLLLNSNLNIFYKIGFKQIKTDSNGHFMINYLDNLIFIDLGYSNTTLNKWTSRDNKITRLYFNTKPNQRFVTLRNDKTFVWYTKYSIDKTLSNIYDIHLKHIKRELFNKIYEVILHKSIKELKHYQFIRY